MRKNNCEVCLYYNKITNILGSCNVLYVATREGASIIGTRKHFEAIAKDMDFETIYGNPIVLCFFLCVYFVRNRNA